jgi:hypothetical protein
MNNDKIDESCVVQTPASKTALQGKQPPPPPLDAPMEEWAVYYAQHRGWYVFPVYPPRDGKCTCGNKDCKNPGKHPCIGKRKNHPEDLTFIEQASRDPDQIHSWWRRRPSANIGFIPGRSGTVVLDIDTKKGAPGRESLAALEQEYGPLPATLRARTGSGNGAEHRYYQYTGEPIHGRQGFRKGIDIVGEGGSPAYVNLPPSMHKTGKRYEWINPGTPIAQLPTAWARLLREKKTKKKPKNAEKEAHQENRTHTAEQLRDLLAYIPHATAKDTDDPRDWWVKVCTIIKGLPYLSDEVRYQLADEWSARGDKYDPEEQRKTWDSLNPEKPGWGGKPLSLGTLVREAKLNGWPGWDPAASKRLETDWVFILGTMHFRERAGNHEWNCKQFDAKFAYHFERKPSEGLLKNQQFERVDYPTYFPGKQERVVMDQLQEGTFKCWNCWQPNPLQPAVGDVTKFLDHISYMLPNPEEAHILLDYLAYQVKYPGEKVHWAVLLSGKQGIGKSYLTLVMQLALGVANVRLVDNKTIAEHFTGWQRNTQFIIVEETKLGSYVNIREVMNKLKPMITEPWCSIREMYSSPYVQPNRFNFLFLTNNSTDALSLDADDRRYCVLASPAEPREPEYYKELFTWTHNSGAALLHYFANRQLTGRTDAKDFQPMAHAPMTGAKHELIRDSMPALHIWIDERVEAQEYPFQCDLVNASDVVDVMLSPEFRTGLPHTNAKQIAAAFRTLGYRPLGRKRLPAANNPPTSIWAVRGNFEEYEQMNGEQLRQCYIKQFGPAHRDAKPRPAAVENMVAKDTGAGMEDMGKCDKVRNLLQTVNKPHNLLKDDGPI